MKNLNVMLLSGLLCVSLSAANAEEVEVVLEGLKNPCGVAVQPGTGDVFVSDTAAGKIIRLVDGKAQDVVTGSAIDVYGKGPKYDTGPFGLAFLDKDRLAVGDGGYADGEEYIRVFEIPAAGEAAIDYDECEKIGPLTSTDEIKAEGNLYALAITGGAIFVTCNGDDTKGWVARSKINGTKFGELERFIATKEATDVDAPVGITVNKRGHLVVGQMGEISVPHDSLLTFYNAKTGKMLLNAETGLSDIAALTYSPKGHLYALDFAWAIPEEAGLFRLDKDGDGVTSVKITNLEKPTAMAFGKDGSLYITLIGKVKEGEQSGAGQLIKLAPGL